MSTQNPEETIPVAGLSKSSLHRPRWDWILKFILPTVSASVIFLGFVILIKEVKESRSQSQEFYRQQILQDYLTNMTFLALEHGLGGQKPNEPASIAATILTSNTIDRLTFKSEQFDIGRNFCSVDLQYCSPEKSSIIDSLVQFNLVQSLILVWEQDSSNNRGQSETQELSPTISLAGLDLANISPSHLYMLGVDLSDSDLRGSILSGGNLFKANLSRANLSMSNLSESMLRMADLSSADLSGANLKGARLPGANLRTANLRGTNFSEASMSGTNLKFANLSGANLARASLRRADLHGASLSGADLRGADLREINLEQTNLEGAIYTNEEFGCPENWETPCSTQFPEDFDHEQADLILWQPTQE